MTDGVPDLALTRSCSFDPLGGAAELRAHTLSTGLPGTDPVDPKTMSAKGTRS